MSLTAQSQAKVFTLLATLLLAGCTNRADQCSANANCDVSASAGAGGEHNIPRSTHAATPSAGGNAGSSSSASEAGGSKGGDSASSSGGASCSSSCEGSTPVCKTEANACVQCLSVEHCKDATKPFCSTATNTCVLCLKDEQCAADPTKPVCDMSEPGGVCVQCLDNEDCSSDAAKPVCDLAAKSCVMCLENADCKNASAPLCDSETHTCKGCSKDEECTGFDKRGVCDAGACVECTAEKEGACGDNSCNAEKNSCTQTKRKSVGLCGACEADSECATNTGVSVARCVKMSYQEATHGAYCLEAVSSGCEKPYGNTGILKISAESVSGAASDDYCGINQSLVTCEAIIDMRDSADNIRCGDSDGKADSSLCGCKRDADGKCTDKGAGGICGAINGALRCTIQCGSGAECTSDRACKDSESPNFCG